MRIAHRWLLTGAMGAALFVPTAGHAQQPPSEGPLSPPAAGTPSGTPSGTPAPAPGSPFGGIGAAAGPAGSYLPPPPIVPGRPISVMVFPFGYPADAAPEAAPEGALQHRVTVLGAPPEEASSLTVPQRQLAARATAAVKAALLATPAYEVQTYHPRSALVTRARNQGILEPAHLQNLYSPSGEVDAEKARTIAHRLGIQAVLLGTLEPQTEADANRAEVTLDAQLVNSTTGEVIRAGVVSGAAQGTEGVAADLVLDRAVVDAAHRLYPALGIQLVTPPPPVPAEKNGRRTERQQRRERREATPARPAATAPGRQGDDKAAAPVGEATAQPPTAPAAPADTAAPAAPATPDPNAVSAVANEAGEPVPYGYARAETEERRDRTRIKIPSWLGLAAFLTGVSFLL